MPLVATIIAAENFRLTQQLLDRLMQSIGATQTAWLEEGKAADIFCDHADARALQNAINKNLDGQPCDVIVQPIATRRKKLLLADMESTIIEQEMLDELAGMMGMRDQVAAITRRAMNGELDFTSALRERVALLKGKPQSMLDEAAKGITFMPGAAALIATMKAHGATCWLVSGGFTHFVQPVAQRLGFDKSFANELVVRGGILTGEVADPILDKNSKKNLLEKACAEMGLALSDCLTVGDGANDVPMLETCNQGGGLGVAYHAKPKVRETISNQINHSDLKVLLYAQGYNRKEIQGIVG